MICKSSLVFGLSVKLRIGPAFVKKVFGARKTFRDFGSLIKSKAFARALVGVVDQGTLVVKNVSKVRETLEGASGS